MTDESPRQETSVQAAWTRVWRTMLVRGIILVVAVAVLGMGIGYLVSGAEGLNGGAVGGDWRQSSSSSPWSSCMQGAIWV